VKTVIFWGCPSLCSGRAVSQLAVHSALRRQRRLGLALWATAAHPSAEALRAFTAATPPVGPKKGPIVLQFLLKTKLALLFLGQSKTMDAKISVERPSDVKGWPKASPKPEGLKGRASLRALTTRTLVRSSTTKGSNRSARRRREAQKKH